MNEAQRAQFEQSCIAKGWTDLDRDPDYPNEYLSTSVQIYWNGWKSGYGAGAADARAEENEACAGIADGFIEANPHSSLPIQISQAIRARQKQGKVKP